MKRTSGRYKNRAKLGLKSMRRGNNFSGWRTRTEGSTSIRFPQIKQRREKTSIQSENQFGIEKRSVVEVRKTAETDLKESKVEVVKVVEIKKEQEIPSNSAPQPPAKVVKKLVVNTGSVKDEEMHDNYAEEVFEESPQ